MTKTQLSWTVGIVGGLLAAGVSLKALWPSIGWETPVAHKEDIEEIHEGHTDLHDPIMSAITAVSAKMDVNQEQWLCDENNEELIDLLQAQAVNETIERSVKIEGVRAKMKSLECTRFED